MTDRASPMGTPPHHHAPVLARRGGRVFCTFQRGGGGAQDRRGPVDAPAATARGAELPRRRFVQRGKSAWSLLEGDRRGAELPSRRFVRRVKSAWSILEGGWARGGGPARGGGGVGGWTPDPTAPSPHLLTSSTAGCWGVDKHPPPGIWGMRCLAVRNGASQQRRYTRGSASTTPPVPPPT